MNLRDLEYFKYLSESLSFTKTAEHFFVSQPSISIALRRLEDEFNTTLIQRERSSKSIFLTPTGKILYQRTIDMLSLYEQIHNDINQVNITPTTLGFVPTIGHHFLPQLLGNVQQYTPNLRLINAKDSEQLIQDLRNKSCESAILMHETPTIKQKWLNQKLLVKEALSICLNQRHRFAAYRELSVNELKNESFVSFAQGHVHESLLHQWALEVGFDTERITYVKDVYTLSQLVADGSHIALLMPYVDLFHDTIIRRPLINAPIGYISLVTHQEASSAQKIFNHALLSTLTSTT